MVYDADVGGGVFFGLLKFCNPCCPHTQLPAARTALCLPLVVARAAAPLAIPADQPGAPPPSRVHLIAPDGINAAPPRVAEPHPRVPAPPRASSLPRGPVSILPNDEDIHLHRYPTRSRRVAGRRRPIPSPRPRPDLVAFLAAVSAALDHSVSFVVHELTG